MQHGLKQPRVVAHVSTRSIASKRKMSHRRRLLRLKRIRGSKSPSQTSAPVGPAFVEFCVIAEAKFRTAIVADFGPSRTTGRISPKSATNVRRKRPLSCGPVHICSEFLWARTQTFRWFHPFRRCSQMSCLPVPERFVFSPRHGMARSLCACGSPRRPRPPRKLKGREAFQGGRTGGWPAPGKFD